MKPEKTADRNSKPEETDNKDLMNYKDLYQEKLVLGKAQNLVFL